MADRLRLFAAVELPEPVREAVARWRRPIAAADATGRLRLVAPEALHVTLCFLGSQGRREVDAIAAACGVVAGEAAPRLALSDPLWLPRRRPRVLAVELDDPDARLVGVQAALARALAAGGWYEPEARPYLAHVTVARVKTRGSAGLPELPELPRLDFVASRVVLYRSRLTRGGAVYEPLAGVELGAG